MGRIFVVAKNWNDVCIGTLQPMRIKHLLTVACPEHDIKRLIFSFIPPKIILPNSNAEGEGPGSFGTVW